MNLEYCQSAIPVGSFDSHAAVEASRAQERFIESIRSVCGSDYDDSLANIKTVHLNEQLVQCLLALIVAIDAGATLATNGIDFVDKDDAWRRFLRLVEKITHATGAYTHQHFYKL